MIRPYNLKDQTRILQILKENTPEYFAPHEHKDLLHYLQNEIEYYFVLEDEDIVKGSGGYNLNEDGNISISWDLVDPNFQGQGVGRQLLHYRLERIFKHHEPKKVIVRTSQLTFGFYTKFGFVVREIKKDYWSKGLDLYYMELPIPHSLYQPET